MSERALWRERSIWLMVIAALSTGLAWASVACALAIFGAPALSPHTLALARAIVRAILALALEAWPVLPLIALGGAMVAVMIGTSRAALMRREVRHE